MTIKKKIVIIGSGPAGLTAGIYAGRADLKPLIIEGAEPGGQLMGTTLVENWPGKQSILGPELMMDMKKQTEACGATFLAQSVTRVDFSQQPFLLWTNKNEEIHADTVIVATGATPKRLGCPGENEYWGKGVTTCAVCDGAFYKDKKVIVVGGGDTAMEDASFLKKFTKDITIFQILDNLTASQAMQKRVLSDSDITIKYNYTIKEIKGNGNHVTHAVILNTKTKETKEIEIDGIFVAIGLNPNTGIFKDQLELDKWGYMKVSDYTKTSVPGVFAAGDVFDYRYRQAVTAAGSGCKASLDAERWLSQQEK